ncbi:alpha/beta hydrolase [Arcobacter sp. CECT 8983]|uniref:alpha/beta hydrolase n=1 Tax=Arcobacter sp. CECT 8983 TaxID=2044508 RepID=UPI00100AD80C|nr:alpha/beta hydrolase [Arcobacter sp. CECT 8983]RXJ91711.1 alpha/beta hydrolase [Arcobacter sp. CECT 8983]
MKSLLLFLLIVLFFNACSSIATVEERITTSNKLIQEKQIKKEILHTNIFSLYSLQKTSSCNTLRVYIEGDGLSWLSRTRISNNPTPINPLAMKLFLKDKSSCKIYLARPCQYTKDSKCEKKYWTSHRYSKEVLSSYLNALDLLKQNFLNKEFELIGYSGGGAIATLISVKREDVRFLLTVAGNIDHKYWTQKHNINSLYGSLNPPQFAKSLEKIKQVHLIGEKDTIIDSSIFNSYYSYFKNTSNIKHTIFKDFTHQKGWEENWIKILNNNYLF